MQPPPVLSRIPLLWRVMLPKPGSPSLSSVTPTIHRRQSAQNREPNVMHSPCRVSRELCPRFSTEVLRTFPASTRTSCQLRHGSINGAIADSQGVMMPP